MLDIRDPKGKKTYVNIRYLINYKKYKNVRNVRTCNNLLESNGGFKGGEGWICACHRPPQRKTDKSRGWVVIGVSFPCFVPFSIKKRSRLCFVSSVVGDFEPSELGCDTQFC